MDDVERLAAQVGVTARQARELLAAVGHSELPTAAVSTTATRERAAAPGRLIDATAWAAAAVAVVAMVTFLNATSGFDDRPHGKVGALVVGLVFGAVAAGLGLLARRHRYRLGEQLAFSVVALISPLITWALLWIVGLWPGHWITIGDQWGSQRVWDGGSQSAQALASLAVCVAPLALGAWVAVVKRAGLALAVALLAGHGAIAALAVIADIGYPGDTLTVLLVAAYFVAFTAVALNLERIERSWATWTHPYAIAGAFGLVGSIADVVGSGAGLTLGALLIAAGALATMALRRGLYLHATVIGGAIWDAWLYEELSWGPVAALALTLSLGLGAILLALATWRFRDRVLDAFGRPAAALR
jgi:hypothetical protein